MTMKISDIKAEAMGRLSKCWIEVTFISVLSSCPYIAAYTAVLLVAAILDIRQSGTVFPVFTDVPPVFIVACALIILIAYLVTAPLYFGVRWFFYHAAKGTCMPVSSVLATYSSRNSVKKLINLKLRMDMHKLTCLLPCSALVFVEADMAGRLSAFYANRAVTAMIVTGSLVFFICMITLYYVMTMKYMPTGYIMAADPDSTNSEIVAKCVEIAPECKGSLLRLYLSFIGWSGACMLIFPCFFVRPYFLMCKSVIMKRLFDGRNEEADSAYDEKENVYA